MKRPIFMRLSIKEQMSFAKRLAMILRAGIPIIKGLHMIGDRARGSAAKYIYSEMIVHVEHGQSLASSMKLFEKIFGEFAINIVRVGETSSTLYENLDHLAEELKKRQALKSKVIGALVYPAVIIFATVGISLVLTIYIFPKITPIFQSFKSQLPLPTRILISLSNFLMKDGVWLFVVLIIVAVCYLFLLRIKRFHLFVDTILVHLPLFGTLSRYYNLANSARTLGLLLKADVGIVQAFAIVTQSTRNIAYRNVFHLVSKEVMKGERISTSLQKESHLFPPLFCQMLLVGEETGNLPSSLSYLSDMYDEEIEGLTKNLTTILEPALMIMMGVVVGFIAISIITPIYGITQSISNVR